MKKQYEMPLLSVVLFTSNGQVDTADPVCKSGEESGGDFSTFAVVPVKCTPKGGDIFSNKF